jgi:hypothetical protein
LSPGKGHGLVTLSKSRGMREGSTSGIDLESEAALVKVYLLVPLSEGSIVKKEVIRRIRFGLVGG